ncbi:metal ABC transporter ATP-binding protein [Frankia sp. Cr2]|uniref:metal ABC transporter ATP-binding protein n=1 Tax=Frankia sp. Cr2 TaxID=3073932 RepID=UPI002AD29CD8|nr:metal ABC transporter ATP-binding protein [Frankia sp. Cr2]
MDVGAVRKDTDPASDRPTAVLFDRATLAYGREPVVEDVDGVVRVGSTVALIGPNGGGKSTLIKAMLGLVPVVGGSIQVLGRTPARARRDVAYVPQADTLDPEFPVSVHQVVLMGRYRTIGWVRPAGRSDRRIAAQALAAVGLAHRAADRFGTLSGGQRQRVLLARAIAQQPKLLLLDEPFNGVDAVSQEALLRALGELRDAGATVIVSTHDLSLVHLACDDVCLLNRHQFGFGPTSATLTPDRLRAAYGGAALQVHVDNVIVAHS